MKTEYRVVWQRVGIRAKRKRYATRRAADRFMVLLGPEPWLAFGKDPDALYCCSGDECGCGGLTVREQSDDERAKIPALEYVRLQERAVGEWQETVRP